MSEQELKSYVAEVYSGEMKDYGTWFEAQPYSPTGFQKVKYFFWALKQRAGNFFREVSFRVRNYNDEQMYVKGLREQWRRQRRSEERFKGSGL